MSAAAEILGEFQDKGVSVRVEGGILCLKPKVAVDDPLLARIRRAKPEILTALRRRAIEVRLWPTVADPAGDAVRELLHLGEEITESGGIRTLPKGVCGHCEGQKFCGCPLCSRGKAGWHGRCVTCGGSGCVQ